MPLSPAAQCATQGYVAGFFDTGDFDGPADPNSNQGEIFYTIVPDPQGTVSCAHSTASLGDDVPATFLHELQHLIYFSQHVIVSGTGEGSSWMDEGMSIVAEELGSLYYEQKCPPPSCRTSPAQLFPDSSQGFIQGFLYDSYQFALLPDTVSVTLHDDSENGFSWRGGAWLMMRWLGDQVGTGIYRKLERGPANGVANIEQATGQSFPALFANFGLALATDSLRGLPRATAPQANRFTTRNMKALWARLFATSGGSSDIPLADPVILFPITSDTSVAVMSPGTDDLLPARHAGECIDGDDSLRDAGRDCVSRGAARAASDLQAAGGAVTAAKTEKATACSPQRAQRGGGTQRAAFLRAPLRLCVLCGKVAVDSR